MNEYDQINDNSFLMMGKAHCFVRKNTITLTDKAEEGFFFSYVSVVVACLFLCG